MSASLPHTRRGGSTRAKADHLNNCAPSEGARATGINICGAPSRFAACRYEGEWVDDKINGQGTLWYADGDQYQGEWRDGKMHGRGTYTYADGDQYEGDWKDDRRHGKGTVTYAAVEGGAAEKYEGDWSDGKMHGYGKYFYADGGVYEGEWVDGKMHGRGYARATRTSENLRARRRAPSPFDLPAGGAPPATCAPYSDAPAVRIARHVA